MRKLLFFFLQDILFKKTQQKVLIIQRIHNIQKEERKEEVQLHILQLPFSHDMCFGDTSFESSCHHNMLPKTLTKEEININAHIFHLK